MTTFDEHSRDEAFRDYLTEARAAKDYAASGMDALPETADRLIGRGQIHATLAHAAATLLAAMPEPAQPTHEDVLRRMAETIKALRRNEDAVKERDALRARVDELVAAGLPKHEPGTAPLCTCGHAQPLHYGYTGQCRDCVCEHHTPAESAPLCTCGHHFDSHGWTAASWACDDCDCKRYTPNTTEVDGWSEPAARGARFRVARFEQNDHVPPVFFKVTDQLGRAASTEFVSEAMAQAHADSLNSAYPSTGTDASVETEAQPESPATALVTAAEVAISPQWDDETSSAWTAARAATIAVLRALASTRESFAVYGLADTVGEYLTRMANELEHTDTPTTE